MLLLCLGAVAKLFEIGERLVVELEEIIRLAGERVVPSARIPGPADAFLAEPVADGNAVLRRQQLLGIGDLGRVRLIAGLDRIDRIAVRRDRTVLQERAVGVELRHHVGRRIGVFRRAGTDQIDVIEERAAEGAVEEVVGQRILLRIGPELGLAGVVIAHDQPAGVRIEGELVHLAAVDLLLLLVEAVHQVARHLVERHILPDIEWLVRQSLGEPVVDDGRLLVRVHDGG